MGEMLDKYERLTLHKATTILCVVILGAALCLYLLELHQWVIAVLYGMMLAILQILVPIINSLGMYYINRKVALNFGIGRGGGSLFYAVSSVVIGKVVERNDESFISVLIIGATLCDNDDVSRNGDRKLFRWLFDRPCQCTRDVTSSNFSRGNGCDR